LSTENSDSGHKKIRRTRIVGKKRYGNRGCAEASSRMQEGEKAVGCAPRTETVARAPVRRAPLPDTGTQTTLWDLPLSCAEWTRHKAITLKR
jgi:hypothetical protein